MATSPSSEPPLEAFLRSLAAAGLLPAEGPRGVDAAILARWEATLPAPLPAAYRAFLLCCGSDCGGFHARSRWRFHELPDLRGEVERELKEAGHGLLANELPILFHAGVITLTLHLGDEPGRRDPPVWGYAQRNGYARRRHFPDFITFLTASVTEYHALPWNPS